MIRLLLVDDHALIRRGMRDALQAEGFEIAAEAGSWMELEPLLASATNFDVLLLDINLPGASGLDILGLLSVRKQPPRVLVVSMYPEDQYAVKALRAGAWGYVNKSTPTPVLAEAIRSIALGQQWVPPGIAALLAQPEEARTTLPHDRLTAREQELMLLLASGQRLQDIADRMALPARTVSVYRARLLEKMKMASNAELTHYAVRHGLLPPDAAAQVQAG